MQGLNKKYKIVSVSVSPFMAALLERYKFSPTDVFRKGMAVSLFDKNIPQFVNEKNRERSKCLKLILKSIADEEKFEKLKQFVKEF